MNRYVVEKVRGGHDRDLLQVCIVYPSEINRKRVAAENEPYSHKVSQLVYDKPKNIWRYEKL